jgi:hypothetical protein
MSCWEALRTGGAYSPNVREEEFPEAHLITFNTNITHLGDPPSADGC